MSMPTHSLSATIERIRTLDRLYLEADRALVRWQRIRYDRAPLASERAQRRYRAARRRYEALRDSEEGMP